MTPTSRDDFKEVCLRRLGKPVINIELDDDQIDDIIDYSLKYFADYHYDGSQIIYYKHQVTDQDKVNRYITLPENILGAVRVFPVSGLFTANDGLFNIQYQIALNDLYTLTNVSMVPYYMMRQHLNLIQEILVGQIPIRFNRHKNRLNLDFDWSRIDTGQFLLVEAHEVIDPEEFSDVWGDRWLAMYVTAQMKKQWGTNLKKFGGMSLVGGVQFNGQVIYDEAVQEIQNLEAEMINSYSTPLQDFVG